MKQVLKVEGMCCHHCAEHVEEAALKIEGINKAKVNLRKGELKVVYDNEPDWNAVKEAIKQAGYEVK